MPTHCELSVLQLFWQKIQITGMDGLGQHLPRTQLPQHCQLGAICVCVHGCACVCACMCTMCMFLGARCSCMSAVVWLCEYHVYIHTCLPLGVLCMYTCIYTVKMCISLIYICSYIHCAWFLCGYMCTCTVPVWHVHAIQCARSLFVV